MKGTERGNKKRILKTSNGKGTKSGKKNEGNGSNFASRGEEELRRGKEERGCARTNVRVVS